MSPAKALADCSRIVGAPAFRPNRPSIGCSCSKDQTIWARPEMPSASASTRSSCARISAAGIASNNPRPIICGATRRLSTRPRPMDRSRTRRRYRSDGAARWPLRPTAAPRSPRRRCQAHTRPRAPALRNPVTALPARCAYATDLTDDQWAAVAPMITDARPGGRPRKGHKREIVEAILYLLRAGCAWRLLPHDFPPWQTVHHHLRRWEREASGPACTTRYCLRTGSDPDVSPPPAPPCSTVRPSRRRIERGSQGL